MGIITLDSVTKRFGDFIAVDNISLSLEPLTINGFLGPNGAGKTTTIRMMSGLLKPSSGSIILDNIDVCKNPEMARGRIGYMSQNFSLYADLNAEENILFFADLFNMKGKDKRERFQEVVEALNLKNYLKVLTGDLPLGIKQRIALASATIHKPSILFLDEPTSGVDPISRREFFYYIMNFIKRYKATVVLSTHFLNEAEYCNMIFFFNKGKIILDGRPADILNNFEYNIFEIARFKESEKLLNILKDDISVVESYIYGKKIRIIAKKEVKREHIAALLNIGENHINITKPSLDDVFIRSTNV